MALTKYTPSIRIDIAGVDVTSRLTRTVQGRWDPITIGTSLDYPELLTFRSNLIQFNLDNADGDFDYSTPNNFFVRNGFPAHGRGASVLIELGLSATERVPVFAGQVSGVRTSLQHTRAEIRTIDLSTKLRRNRIEAFGEEITRKITDFDGASADYDNLDPIFYFPIGLRAVLRGSVSLTVHENGGDVSINIVDTVKLSGVLSNRNAEIDYGRGLIRFEAPPADGETTQITATWKVAYAYKRPDYLTRQLIKHSGLQSQLGITDDTQARFGITQALMRHPSDRSFTSHGRPYPQENGVVRWMRRQGGDTTITRTRTIGSFNIEGALFHRGSIANSSSLAQIEAQCVPANSRTLSSDLTSPSTTNFTEFVGENYIYRQYIVLQTPNRLTNVKVRFPNGVDDAALIAIYPVNEDGSRASDTPLATLFQRSYDSGTVTVSDTISQSEWGSTERIRIEYFMIEIGGGQRGRWQFGYTEAGQAERVPQYITSSFPLVSYTETETETVRNPSVVWQMIQDQRFIEYDEHLDEYTKIADLPSDEGLEGIVDTPGEHLSGEDIDVSSVFTQNETDAGVDRQGDRIYLLDDSQNTIQVLLLDGTPVLRDTIPLSPAPDGYAYRSLTISGNLAFLCTRRVSIDKTSPNRIYVYNIQTKTRIRSFGSFAYNHTISLGAGSQFLYVVSYQTGIVTVYDFEGNIQRDQQPSGSLGTNKITGIGVNANNIHVGYRRSNSVLEIRGYTRSWVRDAALDFEIAYRNYTPTFDITDTRLYSLEQNNQVIKVYELGVAVNFGGYVPYQFATVDSNEIFFIAANNTQGNAVSQSTLRRIKIYKLNKSTRGWTDLLNATTGQPQLSHAYKFPGQRATYLADNRKNFAVVRRNGKTLVFFRFATASASGIRYWNDTDGTLTTVYTESHSGRNDFGLPYSMDFALDIRNDGIYVYTFVVRHQFDRAGNYAGGNLRVYRKRVEPNGSQSRIFAENFVQVTDEEDYPVSVSDLILADDRSKFYFVLDWHGEGDRAGKAELCTIAKSGSGSRTVLKTYENPLIGARSPAKMGSRYFYLEGGWVRRPKDPDTAEETYPDDQYYYPNEGGKLIEIESNDAVTDHGQVWRSATKDDHPDADDDSPIYDGWGLHNTVISNMIADDRDNLHFVAGYGSPYNIDENLPFSSNREPVPALSNFQWLQWGKDLATKIASFPSDDVQGWELIQRLAQVMNYEIGFGPGQRKVAAIQAAHPNISNWAANASLFFRPRTIQPATLRLSISASGTPSQIQLNDSGLPSDSAEFPTPPTGGRYSIIIGKEIFSYTGVTPDAQGSVLTGIQRAQNGSTAAAHAADADVYFVDYFASGELGTTLVNIQSRSLDFVYLRNDVKIGYGDAIYPAKDDTSITEHGELSFSLENSLLSRFDSVWAELIGDTYLDQLSSLKELVAGTLVFSPQLQPSQSIVVYQQDRLRIEFKLFRVLQQQHHIPRWQTGVTALEIV